MKHVYKTIKRIFSFTLALFFLLALFPLSVFASEAVANGTFGDALVWTLDAEGTLTISGAGAMPDYTYTSHAPWYNSRNTIKGVIIDNGVENIGNFAFIGCSRLESVIIGDNVTCIGDRAFDDCISLDSISIPENVVKIGVMAFVDCKSLSIIYFEGNAPEFEVTKLDGSGIYASFCFQDVTATVYYPAGNITWTDEIMQDYSGNITWHPYEMKTGSTSELSNGVTLYIPVVESRLDKYKHDDLTVEDQQKCRGLLYDLNGDNTVELILRLKDEYSFYYEVWSITNEKAVCVNEPFFWGFEPRVLLSHFEGRKALVYQDWSAGSGAASEITTVYTFEEIPYKESYTLHHENIFDIDTPDEIGDYYYINGSKVSENEYKEQLSIVTDGIELFAAETQYEGLNLPELLNYLKDNPTSSNTEIDTTGVIRLAGKDRLITSYLVADQLKEKLGVEKFDAVIVASGSTFADALPGSYLSAVKNAPILLTLAKDKYIQQTADYIKANLKEGGTVYILGGTSAVPETMDAALKDYNVQRVAGKDRFGTNLEILKVAGVKAGDEILVCEGKGYADSLSASATGKPILLVYKKVTDEQKTYLKTLSGNTFCVVGGTTAVPDSIAKEMENYGAVTRLAGKDRLETSTMVAEKYFKGATAAVVAYGWDFPDGLCGGSLAYALDAPLILTHSKTNLYTFAADYTTKAGLKAGYVLGGDGLVSDEATRAIFSMGNGPIHILK